MAWHLAYKGPDLARDGFDTNRRGREDPIEVLEAENAGVHRGKIQQPNRQVELAHLHIGTATEICGDKPTQMLAIKVWLFFPIKA
jgi:hypothetical protein